MTEQFALLWSHSQNTLHIETLGQHISLNRQAYVDNKPGDYRLMLVGTRSEVDATADSIRETLRGRALRSVWRPCARAFAAEDQQEAQA